MRLLLLKCCLLSAFITMGNTIVVKNIEELKTANTKAAPGDIIILQNGEWKNVRIALNCKGTSEKPITFKAEQAGKVLLTGNSILRLGGNYIIITGFYFTNGYAGDDAIIKFRINNDEIANNCRVTSTVINNYNNPKRLDENYWVALYGKNNRVDHCSFLNKKNMGVMMAVILDDERSRENHHSIDHNYFGFRLPLASNTGETLRVGVSQHCEFNSNTLITDNFFEHCDGETEVISIKSGRNFIRNNLFKECQGAVVLRHGNFNTVESNVFLGNNKEGTGGVRIINKGQWVVNNLFYQCRGLDFRSPLSIMNGVPNSPANRYVEVTDAVIANNSFIECAPLGFCVGSDTERSVPPSNVYFLNNIYYNTRDSLAYFAYDDLSKIKFAGNIVSKAVPQNLRDGFTKSVLPTENYDNLILPVVAKNQNNVVGDSLRKEGRDRLQKALSDSPGFSDYQLIKKIETNATQATGAGWFKNMPVASQKKELVVKCKTADAIVMALKKNRDAKLTIKLTGKNYRFYEPVKIESAVTLTAKKKQTIHFSSSASAFRCLVYVQAGNFLTINNLNLDLNSLNVHSFISADTSGSSNHSNFKITNCKINNLNAGFFLAAKTSVADSIIIAGCSFSNNNGTLFDFSKEKDKKGYYNVEKLIFTGNMVQHHTGQILDMERTGNDESTMGPYLIFSKNNISHSHTGNNDALIHLYGTQRSVIENNVFTSGNTNKTLILFEDIVKAVHHYRNNTETQSGKVITDGFVQQ